MYTSARHDIMIIDSTIMSNNEPTSRYVVRLNTNTS